MGEIKLTQAQQLAVDLRGRSILVSAAAGSGKTATLTKRIIDLLTDKSSPADISDMLVVTFTRKAAGELKARITKALTEALAADRASHHLSRQLTYVGSAKICTIDSYYKSIVDANFQRLGISSSFRLVDESELAPMRLSLMNSVIDRAYATHGDFGAFCDELTTARSDARLAHTLLDIFKKLGAVPDGVKYLEGCAALYEKEAEMPFFESRAGRSMLNSCTQTLKALLARGEASLRLIDENPTAEPRRAALEDDCECIKDLLAGLDGKDYTAAHCRLLDYQPLKIGTAKPKSEVTEAVKAERDALKDYLLKLKGGFFAFNEKDLPWVMKKSAWFCRMLAELMADFGEAYREEKLALSVCEFSDLRRFVRSLFIGEDGKPTPLAIEESKKFTHIFVDEYQDTDVIQDEIFRAISRNNLFLVGDIKQSIYSFRQAEPAVFAAYRTSFPIYDAESDDGSPCSLFMSENFRCAENIINFTNGVCSYLFRESEKDSTDAGIGYMPEDDLRFSRGAGGNSPVCIAVAESAKKNSDEEDEDDEESGTGLEQEISFVISEIKTLVAHGYLPDGKKIKPCDIAVLARSNSTCTKMAEALAREGIRYANSVGSGLFENPEVLLMLSLLSACDNPRRDLALAGTLRSPIFNFSLSDLVKIRLGRKDTSLYDAMLEYAADNPDGELSARCVAASQRLESYRLSAESMPVHRFIKYLWQDTAALTYAGSSAESRKRTPAERRKNLQQLYEYARQYEASTYRSLHDFVDYVHGIIENDTEVKTEDISDDNTVNIMSVHKSKGLEFPVVFLINTASSLSRRDSTPPILFTSDDGIGVAAKLGDKTGFGTFDTPTRLAAAEKIDSRGIDEAIRILYVALTRARDMLYITASGGKDFLEASRAAAKRRAALGGRTALTEKRSLFAWIMLALEAGRGLGSYTFKEIIPTVEKDAESDEEIVPIISNERIEPLRAELCRRLEYAYPHGAISQIPAKLSVSRLYPEALDQADDTDALIKRVEESEPRTPRFMGGGNDAAERGTATHLFMQFCDFSHLDGSEESVRREADRLLAEGFIPQSAADIIRTDEVAAFSRSALMKEILAAQKLYREQRFNVFLDAADFTSSPEFSQEIEGERLLVQGVIDLFFIDADGRLVLCDYKTDRLTREELKDGELARKTLSERHGEQLGYYSLALERIMGRRPDRVCIFSLHAGCAFDVI